ncbi:MAG: phytanoyl-CoA dioxygenase family protein [Actinomycetes bacterium]
MNGQGRQGTFAEEFSRNGYVLVPGLVTPAQVAALRHTLFTTPERDPEPNPLTLSTMRFASNLFYGSETLRDFLCSQSVVALTTALLGPDVWVRWDQAVWKGHGAPEFPWHQDNGYTGLPGMHLQLWVALTEMNETNGGLFVAPGGHTELAPHEQVGNHVVMPTPRSVKEIRAQPGDVVLFSSFLPHSTSLNSSGAERLAYVAEFLPLSEADLSVAPPHFVVARHGRPAPSFEDLGARWRADGDGPDRGCRTDQSSC